MPWLLLQLPRGSLVCWGHPASPSLAQPSSAPLPSGCWHRGVFGAGFLPGVSLGHQLSPCAAPGTPRWPWLPWAAAPLWPPLLFSCWLPAPGLPGPCWAPLGPCPAPGLGPGGCGAGRALRPAVPSAAATPRGSARSCQGKHSLSFGKHPCNTVLPLGKRRQDPLNELPKRMSHTPSSVPAPLPY